MTPGYGTPDARFIGSIAYTPDRYPPPAPPPDADNDGVADDRGSLPKLAEGDKPDSEEARMPGPPRQGP